MKKIHPIFLSLASGLLLWLSWPTSSLTPLVFLGFAPLLWVADANVSRIKFFGHCFLALFIWNTGSTWWIWNSTDIGSVAAIIANSFLMCLPWWGYHVFNKKFSKITAYTAFISFWMLFEYIHLNWQLSWPWLSLGNVFANQTGWIQWYEYTGVGGGTLWILLVNVLVYDWLMGGSWMADVRSKKSDVRNSKTRMKMAVSIVAVILLPLLISLKIGFLHNLFADFFHSKNEPNVVIVQPNIDPYGKFDPSSVGQQLEKHIRLSESQLDSNTRLVIWPETALSANMPISETETAPVYKPVFDFVNGHPNITLLTGIETMKWYSQQKPESPYARKSPEGYYYDSYNAAVSIKSGQPLQYYIKSKLVPGVETLPTYLNFMGPVFEKFGGTTGGYARDTASVVFENEGNPYVTAPIICYESIYGEYVASYVQKGANIITIMTNDGWWGNTPGHKQHLAYARLRAIETRRWVARSANTGISAVINEWGDIKETQPWDTTAVIKYRIPAFDMKGLYPIEKTFYVKHGDYLYRIFSWLAGLLVLWNVIVWIRNKFGFKSV